jgi:hypothetical protein
MPRIAWKEPMLERPAKLVSDSIKVYTKFKTVDRLDQGLYRVYWVTGGSSLAAAGQLKDGKQWLAPTNWVNGPTTADWSRVLFVELIEVG